jgi:hypothetical protein
MKKLFHQLSSTWSFAKLFSLLAIAAFELSFVPRASGIPLESGGGWDGDWHHHFIHIECDWPTGGGDWTPDFNQRTVTQDVANMNCDATNLDPDGNGKIDTAPAPAGSGVFSLSLSFTIPSNANGQLSGITCTNGVRTYTAYCEQALYDNNGVQGEFKLIGPAGPLPQFATILGCTAIPCTWKLGSLPTTTKGQQTVLDTGQFGCSLAFPEAPIQLGNGPTVTLATNQLLLYQEAFTNGNNQCTAGTVAPITHAARACFGEANLAVTDCNQIGSGGNTSYHVAFQQNDSYVFNVSGFEFAVQKIQDKSNCNNSAFHKVRVFDEPQFETRSIAGLVPFDASLAPTLTVIGDPDETAIEAASVNLLSNRVEISYNQCSIAAQLPGPPAKKVDVRIDGRTIPANGGGDIGFTGQTTVGVN